MSKLPVPKISPLILRLLEVVIAPLVRVPPTVVFPVPVAD